MTDLFTRDGRALALVDDDVFDRAGVHVARRAGTRLYAPDGRYVGTIIGDRVVYRRIDNVTINASFAPRRHVGSGQADRPRAALRGEEPFSPAHTHPGRTEPAHTQPLMAVRDSFTRHGS